MKWMPLNTDSLIFMGIFTNDLSQQQFILSCRKGSVEKLAYI